MMADSMLQQINMVQALLQQRIAVENQALQLISDLHIDEAYKLLSQLDKFVISGEGVIPSESSFYDLYVDILCALDPIPKYDYMARLSFLFSFLGDYPKGLSICYTSIQVQRLLLAVFPMLEEVAES